MSNIEVIRIVSWNKFNPRSDRGNFAWFRFQNSFFIDQVVFNLSPDSKLLFIFLCCEASRHNSDQIALSLEYGSAMLKRSAKQILNDLNELRLSGLVESLNGSSRESETFSQVPYRTEQNKTEQDINLDQPALADRSPQKFDFESLYRKYPKKVGKQKGLARCKTEIRTEKDYQELSQAIDKYRSHCVTNKTEPQFVKHFSTFMSSWRDWVDNDVGQVNLGADVENRGGSAQARANSNEHVDRLKAIGEQYGFKV